jgi:hypothetical protein
MVSTSDGSVVRRLAGHDELIAVAGSPDGRWVVAGDRWGKVALWDAASGEMTGPAEGPVAAHSLLANRLAFSPDSTRLATVGGDQQVRLWQVPSSPEGQLEELASFRGHANVVEALAFAPDGARLFSGAKDATVRVWSLAEVAARLPKPEANPDPGIFGLSPDGRQIVTGAAEGNLRWWAAPGQIGNEAKDLLIFNLQNLSVAVLGSLGASGTIGVEGAIGVGASIGFEAQLKTSLILLALGHEGYDEEDGTLLAGIDLPVEASLSAGVALAEGWR